MVLAEKDTLIRRRRPVGALLAAVALLVMSGCGDDAKVDVASRIDSSKMPTMTTRDISTLISDSGVTQYRIVAPLWEVYDNVEHPYWRFPEGLYLRKFDRKMKVIATIAADSAIYFRDQNLWRLDGRVEVTKEPRELFLSQQVFWDQNKGIVYSDSFIHIENATHMMEGYGFTAKQDFSGYRINKPLGIFPVDRDNLKNGGSSGGGSSTGPMPMRPAPAHAPALSTSGNPADDLPAE